MIDKAKAIFEKIFVIIFYFRNFMLSFTSNLKNNSEKLIRNFKLVFFCSLTLFNDYDFKSALSFTKEHSVATKIFENGINQKHLV